MPMSPAEPVMSAVFMSVAYSIGTNRLRGQLFREPFPEGFQTVAL